VWEWLPSGHEKTLVAPGTYHSILIFPKSHACAHNVKQPVGGGDGKTDADTYPVSGEVSERWFVPKDDALSFVRWLQTAIIETVVKFVVPADTERWGEEIF